MVRANPFARVERSTARRDDAAALGLDCRHAAAMLATAGVHGPRDHAAICLLVLNGLRATECCRLDVADLDRVRGWRVVRSTP